MARKGCPAGRTCDECGAPVMTGHAVTRKYDRSGHWCSDGCATAAWVEVAAEQGLALAEEAEKGKKWR